MTSDGTKRSLRDSQACPKHVVGVQSYIAVGGKYMWGSFWQVPTVRGKAKTALAVLEGCIGGPPLYLCTMGANSGIARVWGFLINRVVRFVTSVMNTRRCPLSLCIHELTFDIHLSRIKGAKISAFATLCVATPNQQGRTNEQKHYDRAIFVEPSVFSRSSWESIGPWTAAETNGRLPEHASMGAA